jgi:hypothetical protein
MAGFHRSARQRCHLAIDTHAARAFTGRSPPTPPGASGAAS